MFTARFPLELEMQLAQHATMRGLSKTAVAIEAMQEYFKRKPLVAASVQTEAPKKSLVEQMHDLHEHQRKHWPPEALEPFDVKEAIEFGRM
jgi:replicative DNA helicase